MSDGRVQRLISAAYAHLGRDINLLRYEVVSFYLDHGGESEIGWNSDDLIEYGHGERDWMKKKRRDRQD